MIKIISRLAVLTGFLCVPLWLSLKPRAMRAIIEIIFLSKGLIIAI